MRPCGRIVSRTRGLANLCVPSLWCHIRFPRLHGGANGGGGGLPQPALAERETHGPAISGHVQHRHGGGGAAIVPVRLVGDRKLADNGQGVVAPRASDGGARPVRTGAVLPGGATRAGRSRAIGTRPAAGGDTPRAACAGTSPAGRRQCPTSRGQFSTSRWWRRAATCDHGAASSAAGDHRAAASRGHRSAATGAANLARDRRSVT